MWFDFFYFCAVKKIIQATPKMRALFLIKIFILFNSLGIISLIFFEMRWHTLCKK